MDGTFGKILEEARLKRDITRTELANVIGRSASSVFRYEKGEQIPGRKMYEKMCDYLGMAEISYEEMFFGEQTAGVMVILDEFWKSMQMRREKAASDMLLILCRQIENEELSTELRCEILLARYVFFYANYPLGDAFTGEVLCLLQKMNKGRLVDRDLFCEMVREYIPLSWQEIAGYNLYALLLLRQEEYELPEVILSALLFLEGKRDKRRNIYREAVLAGNLALCKYLCQDYLEALDILDRYEGHLYHTGGVETHLFYETLRLSCDCFRRGNERFEREWKVAEVLYRTLPKEMKNEVPLETMVFGKKKGLLIFKN